MLIFLLIEVVLLFLDFYADSDRIFNNIAIIIILWYFILVIHSLRGRFRDECAQGENVQINTLQSALPQYVQESVDPPVFAEVSAQ